MMDRYGRAVVEERTQPRNLAGLRDYMRLEYGLGTEPDAYLRGTTRGTGRPQHRVRRAFRKVMQAMARVVGAQATTTGGRPKSGSEDLTR